MNMLFYAANDLLNFKTLNLKLHSEDMPFVPTGV